MTQTIKVRFKAYDNNLLDQTVREIVNAVAVMELRASGKFV